MDRPIGLATHLAEEGLDERRRYRGAVLTAAVLALLSLGLFRTAPAFAADVPTALRHSDQHLKRVDGDDEQGGALTWGDGTRCREGNDHTGVTNGGGKTTVNGQDTGQDHTGVTNGGAKTTVNGQDTGRDHTGVTNGGAKTTVNGQDTGQDHTDLTNGGSQTTMDGQQTGEQADDDGNGWESDTWNGGDW